MEIAGNEYRVHRARDSAKVIFEGTLRLSGTKAYKPIAQLLQTVGEDGTDIVTLDMRKLQFLNSAGINMLYKFALNLSRKGGTKLVVYGSESFPWQKKVLGNLNHFVKDLEIDFS
ncbi:MAG: hypothetical protein MJE77_29205 [Proteobacteria bacterium]|nr:hypothetical protein [Pseudomonadota bacterium]